MIRDLVCVAVGVLLCGLAFAVIEWRSRRPVRHVLKGNYFSALSPFSIERVGGEPEERSDERVDRMAQRLGRLRDRRWTDASQND